MLEALTASGKPSKQIFNHENTKGGAKLGELGSQANQYIAARAWDVVVLQEYSNLPVEDYMAFYNGVESLMLGIRGQRAASPVYDLGLHSSSRHDSWPE